MCKKRCNIAKNSFLEVFGPLSRLMTRHKTLGSEQVDPPIDSIMGSLSESNHSPFVSTHDISFFEPGSLGSEQVDLPVDSILGIMIESNHSCLCVDSLSIFLSIVSPQVRTGRHIGRINPGNITVWVDSLPTWVDSWLVLQNFAPLLWEGNFWDETWSSVIGACNPSQVNLCVNIEKIVSI